MSVDVIARQTLLVRFCAAVNSIHHVSMLPVLDGVAAGSAVGGWNDATCWTWVLEDVELGAHTISISLFTLELDQVTVGERASP